MRHWSFFLVCCLVSGPLFAQSLADVAKKEKERRKKSEKPVEVIDERDLAQARGSGGDVETSVTTTGSDVGDDDFPPVPEGWSPASVNSTPPSVPRSNDNCGSVRASLTRAQRRINEPVTVTYRVPSRNTAAHVRTGTNSRGKPIYSPRQTYETRTKKVSCATVEGRKHSRCQSLQREIDSLRQELRACSQ